jgi:hypothetical protein
VLAFLVVGALVGLLNVNPFKNLGGLPSTAIAFNSLDAFIMMGLSHSAGIPGSLIVARLAGGGALLSGALISATFIGVIIGIWVFKAWRQLSPVGCDTLRKIAAVLGGFGALLNLLLICTGHPSAAALFVASLITGVGTGFVEMGISVWFAYVMTDDEDKNEMLFIGLYCSAHLGMNFVGMQLLPLHNLVKVFDATPKAAAAFEVLFVFTGFDLGAQLAFMPREEDLKIATGAGGEEVGEDASEDETERGLSPQSESESASIRWRFAIGAMVESFLIACAFSVVECGNTYIFETELGWSVNKVSISVGLAGLAVAGGGVFQIIMQRMEVQVTKRVSLCLVLHFIGTLFSCPWVQDLFGSTATVIASFNLAADVILFFSLLPRHSVTESSFINCKAFGNPDLRALLILQTTYMGFMTAAPVTRSALNAGGRDLLWLIHVALWVGSCSMCYFGIFPYLRLRNKSPDSESGKA